MYGECGEEAQRHVRARDDRHGPVPFFYRGHDARTSSLRTFLLLQQQSTCVVLDQLEIRHLSILWYQEPKSQFSKLFVRSILVDGLFVQLGGSLVHVTRREKRAQEEGTTLMASTTKKVKGAKSAETGKAEKAGFSLDAIKVPSIRIPGAKYGLLLTAAALALIYIDGTTRCNVNCVCTLFLTVLSYYFSFCHSIVLRLAFWECNSRVRSVSCHLSATILLLDNYLLHQTQIDTSTSVQPSTLSMKVFTNSWIGSTVRVGILWAVLWVVPSTQVWINYNL